MPNSYTTVFGGETINPAQLSYIAYTTAVDLTLVWPLEAPPDANVAADKIDLPNRCPDRNCPLSPRERGNPRPPSA